MPVTVVKRAGRYRVIEPSGRISRARRRNGRRGRARDGGGYRSKAQAQKLARAINRSLHRGK